jgi:hypothetical protein
MNSRLTAVACAAIFSCLAGVAFAGPADDLLAGLHKCAAIADDKARLTCYDALAPQVQTALAPRSAPQEESHPPTKKEQESWFGFDVGSLFGSSPTQQTTPQQFGSENLPSTQAKKETAEAELESITAGVTEYAYTPFGKFIVFLDNGQIWRQLEGDADRAYFRKSAKDNRVTIERGLIGSYNLTLNDSSKVYKVTRVK